MDSAEDATEKLFSYGTLQTEAVQLATFGRRLEGTPDALVGYGLTMIRIDDPEFVATSGAAIHRNIQFTGAESDVVEGTILAMTMKELERADSYEPDDYKRAPAVSRSGTKCWIYVKNDQ
jgi:hypothetical protein